MFTKKKRTKPGVLKSMLVDEYLVAHTFTNGTLAELNSSFSERAITSSIGCIIIAFNSVKLSKSPFLHVHRGSQEHDCELFYGLCCVCDC